MHSGHRPHRRPADEGRVRHPARGTAAAAALVGCAVRRPRRRRQPVERVNRAAVGGERHAARAVGAHAYAAQRRGDGSASAPPAASDPRSDRARTAGPPRGAPCQRGKGPVPRRAVSRTAHAADAGGVRHRHPAARSHRSRAGAPRCRQPPAASARDDQPEHRARNQADRRPARLEPAGAGQAAAATGRRGRAWTRARHDRDGGDRCTCEAARRGNDVRGGATLRDGRCCQVAAGAVEPAEERHQVHAGRRTHRDPDEKRGRQPGDHP